MGEHIDLFSGIGGFALAAQWAGFTTVAFIEIEPYAQEVIKQNFGAVADARCKQRGSVRTASRSMESGADGDNQRCRPRFYADIRDFDGTLYRGATLLTGGFPCQPFSQAGKRRGSADDRALWPEMFRVIQQARPAWVLGENVAGIVTMELDRVLSDLESEGYAVQSLVIPACAVDAKHRRDRVWIVAHADCRNIGSGIIAENSHDDQRRSATDERDNLQSRNGQKRSNESESSSEDVADAAQELLTGSGNGGARRRVEPTNGCEWLPEPDVGRVAHGIPSRVDRLKGLGNAIVPQVAYQILKEIRRLI
jgi:DNA (cytosine-5)-methyltransferase 1